MEMIWSVASVLRQRDFIATLNLKDAYLHVPAFQPHRRFLRIAVYLKGSLTHLQFTALLFGISSAPPTYIKVGSAVAGRLVGKGFVKRASYAPVCGHSLFPPAVMLVYKLREVMSSASNHSNLPGGNYLITSSEKIEHSGGHAISGNSSKYDNQNADKSVGPNVSNRGSSSLGSLAPKTLGEQGIMLMVSQSIKAGPQVLVVEIPMRGTWT